MLVVTITVLLASCGCAVNAEPVAPAQVAAAVAAATGTVDISTASDTMSQNPATDIADDIIAATSDVEPSSQPPTIALQPSTKDEDNRNKVSIFTARNYT